MIPSLSRLQRPTSVSLTTRLLSGSLLVAAAASPVGARQAAIADVFSPGAVGFEEMRARTETRAHVAGELVVALRVNAERARVAQVLAGVPWRERVSRDGASFERVLLSFEDAPGRSVALVLVDVGEGGVVEAMRALADDPEVLWSSPNFVSPLADPRELDPDDPSYGSQYHHPLMQNDLAWDFTLGDPSIVIAVTDDGVDTDHEDLGGNMWSNTGEVAADGMDNDLNGYVDDTTGWDFVYDTNDANPNSGGDDHGTHVAGIAAAGTDNAVGGAGTAGGCTIMPLQFFASGQPWTAANIAESFAYAVDNGAQITTTSYNIDTWVGDPVFTAGLQYLYDQGGMHFNSAGNGFTLEPARQVFEQTFLVANTDSSDVKSSSSNWGTGIDLAAPGSSIYSTTPNDSYASFSGTSMAAPNAAGVAALIWSLNPGWTREQVAAQLLATADDIDAANPGLEGLLGSGRVNSYRALTEVLPAPRIESLSGLPADGETISGSVSTIEITFDQLMDPASINAASSYELRESGPDGLFDTADDLLFAVTPSKDYMLGTNDMEFGLGGSALGLGSYRLTLFSGGLENPFGTDLDGDGDGSPGPDFVSSFTIGPERLAPLGSLAHGMTRSASIDVASEVDTFPIKLDAGQSLSALVTGAAGFPPVLEVRDPGGSLVATGASVGSSVLVQGLAIGAAGNYELSVSGVGSATGGYELRLLLNALFEEEAVGAAANDSFASAEDLNPGSLAIGTGSATRLGAVGQAGLGEDFESGAFRSSWTVTSSDAGGRIRITDEYGAADGSQHAVIMDRTPSGTLTLNEAVWTVDLSNVPSPILTFHHAEWSDEETALPLTFTGSANGDGVSISDDGTNWYRILNPTSLSSGVWTEVTVDLTVAAASAGMTLGSAFRIKFQQYDDFPITTDGRGYDQISITSAVGFSDWYSFSLEDGEDVTLAALASTAGATADVELFASDGTTSLASGSATPALSSLIAGFVDPTSDATPETYYARVDCSGGDYVLLVTRSSTFEVENNDSVSTPQDLTGFSGVLGFLEDGSSDTYRLDLPRARFGVASDLPAAGPFAFGNGLALAGGGSALQLHLMTLGGTPVASGSDIPLAVVPQGSYLLRVSGVGRVTGEYALTLTTTPLPYGNLRPEAITR